MGMTADDNALLRLAAKAIGLIILDLELRDGRFTVRYPGGEVFLWNPLTDDGDALRLAVMLGLTPYAPTMDYKFACCQNNDASIDISEPVDADPYAATRRAIVRAAAEIGKAMNNG